MNRYTIGLVCVVGSILGCGGEDRPAQDPSSAHTDAPPATTPASGGAADGGTSMMAPSTGMGMTSSQTTGATGVDTASSSQSASSNRASDTNASNTPSTTSTTTQTSSAGATQAQGTGDQTNNVDNTKVNERDRHGAALTPMDQGGSDTERKITAAIRKGVVADKTLSFTAKNVKIITVGSKVTLRGPVKTDEERASIEARARQTAGVTDVDNQLEVKK